MSVGGAINIQYPTTFKITVSMYGLGPDLQSNGNRNLCIFAAFLNMAGWSWSIYQWHSNRSKEQSIQVQIYKPGIYVVCQSLSYGTLRGFHKPTHTNTHKNISSGLLIRRSQKWVQVPIPSTCHCWARLEQGPWAMLLTFSAPGMSYRAWPCDLTPRSDPSLLGICKENNWCIKASIHHYDE